MFTDVSDCVKVVRLKQACNQGRSQTHETSTHNSTEHQYTATTLPLLQRYIQAPFVLKPGKLQVSHTKVRTQPNHP